MQSRRERLVKWRELGRCKERAWWSTVAIWEPDQKTTGVGIEQRKLNKSGDAGTSSLASADETVRVQTQRRIFRSGTRKTAFHVLFPTEFKFLSPDSTLN